MIDAHEILRRFLLADMGLGALVGERIYAGRSVPPVGYRPSEDGPCVVFRVRGGGPDYDDALLMVSVQAKCYGRSEQEAYQVYRALHDHLHNGNNEDLLHAESEAGGQVLEEPETQWSFALGFFQAMLRAT